MDRDTKIKALEEDVSVMTQIRDRLNRHVGTNVMHIVIPLDKQEVETLIKALNSSIIYFNYERALAYKAKEEQEVLFDGKHDEEV